MTDNGLENGTQWKMTDKGKDKQWRMRDNAVSDNGGWQTIVSDRQCMAYIDDQ